MGLHQRPPLPVPELHPPKGVRGDNSAAGEEDDAPDDTLALHLLHVVVHHDPLHRLA